MTTLEAKVLRAVILLVDGTLACNDGARRIFLFRQEVQIMQIMHFGFVGVSASELPFLFFFSTSS